MAVTVDNRWKEQLNRAIRERRFVPFIGAGVSAARDSRALAALLSGPRDATAPDAIRRTPGALSAYRLGELRGAAGGDNIRGLLDGLAYSVWVRNDGVDDSRDWTSLYPNYREACESHFADDTLETLVGGLRECVVELLATFDRRAADVLRQTSALQPWLEGDRLELTEEWLVRLRHPIEQCLQRSHELAEAASGNDTLASRLAPNSLRNAITSLTRRLYRVNCDWLREPYRAGVDAVSDGSAPVPHRRTAGISRVELGWLIQLLWHLCRYDDPLLPTSRELAFRLTLRLDFPELIIGDLSQVAELIAVQQEQRGRAFFPETVAEVIRDWVSFCHETSRIPVNTYYARVAQAVAQCFPRHLSEAEGWIPASGSKPPLVFTTNYDESIERALFQGLTDKTWRAVHVLFPIYHTCIAGGARHRALPGAASPEGMRKARQRVAWACQTWGLEGNKPAPQSTRIIWQESTGPGVTQGTQDEEFYSIITARLDKPGPIVLKLHGAPTISLGNLRNTSNELVMGTDAEWRHMVLITEAGYVQVLAEAHSRGMPLAALRKVQEGFGLWFIGYSLSDWNIRSQLYLQIRPTNDHEGVFQGPGERFAVMHSVDSFKRAHCKALDVTPVSASLSLFATTLNQGRT